MKYIETVILNLFQDLNGMRSRNKFGMTLVLIIIGISKGAWAIPETQKYENYLNELKTLSGEFTQTNSKGQSVTGTIQISRPGKMRLDYNPPSSLLIVADGKWLVTYDKEADETSYVSLDNTPAAFILRPYIQFSGDVAITSIIPKGNATEISLIRKEDPDAGYISLVFANNPISLKEWSVVDPQGIKTRVVLSKIDSNVDLHPGLFMINSPNLIQQIF
ncbi:MAG: outer membrane lipoprotein carrier protein LolA [Proteobacteria bacterium]|nr:outer membrane lipoprotein carrier protein LolA [Pseudomonadota bacterium]